ncbi:MAG: orotate phosphoribosyltransferase [Actinobacteria bacterium]|nr:orotate phosphoribosyltransferase [Actinomycetota bacterium]MCL6104034.1 orotate phosphoribosyltransferase [Actinomycetota bacterium]
MIETLPPAKFSALRDHIFLHSLRSGEFVLKSGRKSRWFIDAKQTVCSPEGMLLVAQAVTSVMPEETTAIGGLTMGADPVTFATAMFCNLSGRSIKAFSVRKEAKQHGIVGQIAGILDAGDQVVVVEDTVTRGTSIMQAVHAVRELGGQVVYIVAVVDRGGSCAEMAKKAGVEFCALVTAPELGFEYGE